MLTGTVLCVAFSNGDLGKTSVLTAVLGFGFSLFGLSVNLWKSAPQGEEATAGSAPSRERLEQWAERLSGAVEEQWRAEWRLRRLQDPYPLEVRWSPAEAWLVDAPGEVGPVVTEGDRLEDISSVLEAVPSRRLVVLGEPGSGKTMLAVGFILDRLARWQPGDRVPVLFPLAGWQPEQKSLRDWMAAHLAATHPGASWADKLLRAGLVLPVFDGLDEMPQASWATALRRLNTELDSGEPVLVTCRTEAYAKAVETSDVFTAAAVIELRPLTFETVGSYLARTGRPVRGEGGERATRWDPVLAEFRRHPDDPVARTVRSALSTPLMVAMARAAYGDTGRDPAELLDGRFADPEVLERHLLDSFVPAAFADSPRAEEARAWLGELAAQLQRQTTRQLAWWRLRRALPWPLRTLGPILLLGCVALLLGVAWIPAAGLEAPAMTCGFILGVGLGYTVLGAWVSPRRRRAEWAARVVVTAVLAGVLVGAVASTSLDWTTSLPNANVGPTWLGAAAFAMAFGLTTAIALGVLGIIGEPLPSYAAFGGRGSVRAIVVVFMSAVIGFLLPHLFLVPPWVPPTTAMAAGALVAVGLRNWQGGSTRGASSPRPQRARGHFRTALLRGLRTGLLTGLALGAAFGVTTATVAGTRAAVSADFPAGVVHHLTDGTRYVVTADGWVHGVRPNDDRYLRTPEPVDGVVEAYPDGTTYASPAATARQDCTGSVRCTPFHGRIELELRASRTNPQVRLPSGAYVEDSEFQTEVPSRSYDWLFAAPPSVLFGSYLSLGLTAGLGLGLVSGLAAGFHAWMVSPIDTARAAGPQATLRFDRVAAITRGVTLVAFGVVAAAFASVALAQTSGQSDSFGLVLLTWLLVGPFSVFISAWGWLLVTRLWLCGNGRLPWRLMAFLEEAHQRGVLRQAGAAYEFRHARLQEHLASSAAPPSPSPSPSPPPDPLRPNGGPA
ncbi:NACHT domain-containing protein [Streptomyces sp. NPDC058122]|uniref:NACHT domain-containing protein n=1 Tax=Streptomyces sp. NPDC058122 TaxID=3346349 RepID=UPI0036DFD7E5